MQPLQGQYNLQFFLRPTPAARFMNMQGFAALKEYGANFLPNIILFEQKILALEIECTLKFKGSLIKQLFLNSKRKAHDIDFSLELKDWKQIEKVYQLFMDIFGKSIVRKKIGKLKAFINLKIQDKDRPLPFDVTIRPYDPKANDSTGTDDGFAIEILPQDAENIELIFTQSSIISTYSTLENSCQLTLNDEYTVSEEHALTSERAIFRYVDKLVRGPFLQNPERAPQLEQIYCAALLTEYNNPTGVIFFVKELKNHILQHFDCNDPDELKSIDPFLSTFIEVIQRSSIPRTDYKTYIDQKRLIDEIETVRASYQPKNAKPFNPYLRFQRLSHYLDAIEHSQEFCEENDCLLMAERLLLLLENPLSDDLVEKEKLELHLQFLIQKLDKFPQIKERILAHSSPRLKSKEEEKIPSKVVIEPEAAPVKPIRTLQEYVDNPESVKGFSISQKIQLLTSLLRKERNRNLEIKELEKFFHQILLDAENKQDTTGLMELFFTFYSCSQYTISYWMMDALEKENKRKAEAIYRSFKDTQMKAILSDIGQKMGKKIETLPQQTHALCLLWMQKIIISVGGFNNQVFDSFILLLRKEKKADQIDLITTVYPKVGEREKALLNKRLFKLLPFLTYKTALSLYQKIKKSDKVYPMEVRFRVFQKLTLLTLPKERSKEFLLNELVFIKHQEYRPVEKNLLEGFAPIFETTYPEAKIEFYSLIGRSLPYGEPLKVQKRSLISLPIPRARKSSMNCTIVVQGGIVMSMLSMTILLLYMIYESGLLPKKVVGQLGSHFINGVGLSLTGTTAIIGVMYSTRKIAAQLLGDSVVSSFDLRETTFMRNPIRFQFLFYMLLTTLIRTSPEIIDQLKVENNEEQEIKPGFNVMDHIFMAGMSCGLFVVTKISRFFLDATILKPESKLA